MRRIWPCFCCSIVTNMLMNGITELAEVDRRRVGTYYVPSVEEYMAVSGVMISMRLLPAATSSQREIQRGSSP